MSFFSKNPMFDKLVDKATSHLLLEPDWASNMTVCDMIRQGEVTGKYAVQSVKKKLNHSNPHVILYALNLVEAMAKNCGSNVHDEINTVDFMTQIKNLVKEKDPVKTKALELIQIWANAFRNQSKYGIIKQTYTNLKNSGQVFPPVIESDAMFISETAPEWQDSDCCYRCKVVFSTLRRKHHCRNCGNIFCDECTNKRSSIPKYGIEKEVRVCESCYDTIKGNPNLIDTRVASGSGGNGPTYNAYNSRNIHKKGVQFSDDVTIRNIPSDTTNQEAARLQKERELELQEKEELELALALSASEAETQNRYKQPDSRQYQQSHQQEIEPGYNANQATSIYSTLDTSEMDPELARYLNRNYWDNKAGSIAVTQPSAPVMPNSPSNSTKQSNSTSGTVTTSLPSGGNSTAVPNNNTCLDQEQLTTEQQEFLRALRSSIEIFVNRMQSNKQRGRSIANDSSVQTLFLTLNAMHPQLLQQINQQDDRRSYLESLQDKLAQIRDAREALDALREEHRDKKRREEEEAARIRQIQMMQKLELMREKKKQYLDYQRQLAVDRMQQQERDMAVKLAQQQYQMQLRQYQQQYPYSNMQQQNQQYMMQDPNNPSVGAGTTGSYVQQQQQQQPPPLQHNYQDFYNMQGMMQQLPYSNQIPYSQQQTVGTPGNIYTNQAAGGSVIPQNQHQDNNSLNQLPNPPTHEPQMTSDTTTQHATQHHHPNKQSEQQLISFD